MATMQLCPRENAVYLVVKLVPRLSTNWQPSNGRNHLALVLDGELFDTVRLRRAPATNMEGAAG